MHGVKIMKKRNIRMKSMHIVKERKRVEVREGKVKSIAVNVATKNVKIVKRVVKIQTKYAQLKAKKKTMNSLRKQSIVQKRQSLMCTRIQFSLVMLVKNQKVA